MRDTTTWEDRFLEDIIIGNTPEESLRLMRLEYVRWYEKDSPLTIMLGSWCVELRLRLDERYKLKRR